MRKLRKLLLFSTVLFVVFTQLFGFIITVDAAETATINLSAEKQVIRGFGGMNHPVWISDLTPQQRDTAFGNGEGQLGFTILRIHVDENRNNWSKEVATARRAIELGAIVFASPWNPPSNMVETFTRNGVPNQKRLRYDKYGDYVQHLNDFVAYMKSNGVDLYAISVQNEPDYAHEWTWWAPQEMLRFMRDYAGQINCRVMAPESFQYLKNMSDPILNDPQALANLDILGAHFYGTTVNNMPYPLFEQKGAGKELWMTEVYVPNSDSNSADRWPEALEVAHNMHNALVEGNFQAYVWWYIRRSYGPMKEDGTISKRGYMMAHYSKFVRPGYVRVDATKNPTYNVYLSAYKNKKDNSVVAVVINKSTEAKTINISVPGTSIRKWERYVTTGSKNLRKESDINASGTTFQVTLEPQSVTTFVGGGSSEPQIPVERNAFSKIECEEYNATNSSTVQVVGTGTGSGLGYIENGNYFAYKNINFGNGANSFKIRAATTGTPKIEIRLGSPTGTLAGTLQVAATGGFNAYEEQSCSINKITGVQDVYLVFGGAVNVDWFTFESKQEPTFKYGDLNGDGNVNSTDSTLMSRYLLGIITTLPAGEKAADLNGDGKVNSTDYNILKRYLLKYIDKFPVES
ncbi:Glucuronoxylanase XynC [Acetivibrio thermocellus BC1]|nr:Glucuronoxylanase XynC [Acetivibrio thermocellus BC1]